MLTASKNYNTEAPPSIIVLDTEQRHRLLQPDCDSATSDGHVADGFVSPFVGMTIPEVVRFVTETARDTVINPYSVFIADERTAADQTVLVVGIHDETREVEAAADGPRAPRPARCESGHCEHGYRGDETECGGDRRGVQALASGKGSRRERAYA
ncbi:hypothetical protein ASPACDRAFT_1857757, partial [Aspergillus aculeatus ATCC 16872]